MTIEGELIAKSTGTTSEYTLGDRVFHQKFGYGRVARIDGTNSPSRSKKPVRKRSSTASWSVRDVAHRHASADEWRTLIARRHATARKLKIRFKFGTSFAAILMRQFYEKLAGHPYIHQISIALICRNVGAIKVCKMIGTTSFLKEIDDAIILGSAESRTRALWHTTDLLITGRYSDDEIETFGEVIGRLADQIEIGARAELARWLASFEQAPVNVIRKLAFDDSIEVAGPVLEESERLDTQDLVENANTKGQPHLLAISKRKSIDERVTDVLVARGDQEVVHSVAKNDGARFSGFGFLHMIKRAEGDAILAENLGLRNDIPRRLFQQLIAKASDDVRKRLEKNARTWSTRSKARWPKSPARCSPNSPRLQGLFRRQAIGGDTAPRG